MKRVLVLGSVGLCLLVVSSALAAPALKVLGSGRSSGDFAVASASGKKNKARSLYLRGYGRELSAFAVVGCSKGYTSIGSKSTDVKRMTAGKLYRLKLPFLGGNCQVTASLSGSGRIRLQILG